jgi:hypothetical protein
MNPAEILVERKLIIWKPAHFAAAHSGHRASVVGRRLHLQADGRNTGQRYLETGTSRVRNQVFLALWRVYPQT